MIIVQPYIAANMDPQGELLSSQHTACPEVDNQQVTEPLAELV